MEPYRELDHTADVGLEISGHNPPELFINGVKGLFHLIAPRLSVVAAVETIPRDWHPETVELNAASNEDLLIHWLNEFIYRFFEKRVYPQKAKIIYLTENNLRAEIAFVRYRGADDNLTEIKAATYHQLKISRRGGSYQAAVIFDV